MASVTGRVGARYEATPPDRRAAAQVLVDDIQGKGLDAHLDVIEYVPGIRGLSPYETIAILIGDSAATTVVNLVLSDVYEQAKAWGRRRLAEKWAQGRAGRGTAFTIYGPAGEVLREWHSDDPDEVK